MSYKYNASTGYLANSAHYINLNVIRHVTPPSVHEIVVIRHLMTHFIFSCFTVNFSVNMKVHERRSPRALRSQTVKFRSFVGLRNRVQINRVITQPVNGSHPLN